MTITTINKEQVVDDICNTAVFYRDVQNIIVVNDRRISIQYLKSGIGSLLANDIGDMMHLKYPAQDYELSIKHGEYSVEISLL